MPSSNEIGSSLERRVKEALGGQHVKQSGGGKFEKLDVKDSAKFIYSCKSSLALSDAAFRALNKLWNEARRGSRGPAGHGNNAKPALVIEVQGEPLVVLRLADHVALVTEEIEPFVSNSKAQERRARVLQNPRER